MSYDVSRPISRQALGRTAFLGSLYDATTDEFCERSIINDDIPTVAIRCLDENHGHSSYEFDTNVSKKLRKLNADASLSLSILGGLVKSAGASCSYLYSREKTTQNVEATFVHRSITRTESLNVSHKELKARVELTALHHSNATHVVTSIRWGADVFAQFEAKSTTAESKHTAKAGLKLELNKLLSKFISINPDNKIAVPVDNATSASSTPAPTQIESGSAGPQISLETTSTKTNFNYKITLFGDLIPTTCPKTIDELLTMIPTITAGIHKTNGGKGRPLEYVMLPISEVADILGETLTANKLFRAVEENVAHEIQDGFDEADRLRTIIRTLTMSIRSVEEFFHEDEITKISSYERNLSHLIRDIRTRIGKMLVLVRNGHAQPSELDQLLVELESLINKQRMEVKQFERGDINEKLKYTLELKEKNVIAVREPETLSIIQNRHPKHQVFVLYTNNELRNNSKDKWISVYFDFIRRIDESLASSSRLLFCYFDYDLHPNYQPQEKLLEIREYIDPLFSTQGSHSQSHIIERQSSANGIDSLFKNVNAAAADCVSKWHRNAKERLNQMFAKSGSRVLIPYSPSLLTRNEIFEKLRRNQKNIVLIGRSCTGKSTFKHVLADPTSTSGALKSYSHTQFPLFEQYSVNGTDIILNFIDTPGLFQRSRSSLSLPDNVTIMQLIDGYIRSKVTQLHFVCFCVSIDEKINTDDLHTVQAFFDYLGPDIRKNACLIITKCESKTEQQLDSMFKEAQTSLDFKTLSSQMKQGIFFTGSINQEDWIDTSDVIFQQFERVCHYRNKLLKNFINSDVKPFDLTTNILARKSKEQFTTKDKDKSK